MPDVTGVVVKGLSIAPRLTGIVKVAIATLPVVPATKLTARSFNKLLITFVKPVASGEKDQLANAPPAALL